ncbi:MAG: LPS export ABC transporter permease LptF [Gammaproteobacteria bacterium]|jgi:lipopolysaccharide export system permease protein|nr:LPS export ABC transporter permease LptF [Chromatiales bacterium]MDP6675004.1 LPS export ABC transporter permease LptF [Gammaproteobacteria bacterium]
MSSILSRYILKETAQTWIIVTVVLLLILLTNQFAQVLGDAAADKLPKEAVFMVMGLTSLQYLTILIPIGLFLSIMLALGRLYRDSEMAALMACGIGPASLYRPLSLLAVILALLVGWLSLSISPGAMREVQIIVEAAKQRVDLRFLEAGRFITFADAGSVMYAESITAAGELGNVFVQRRKGNEIEVIVARRAWQSQSSDESVKVLKFADGRRYQGVPGSPVFEIVSFEEYGMPFAMPAAGPPELKPESRPLEDVLAAGDPVSRAELQWRMSVPLALLVLTFLAVPLSRSGPRQGRYGGVAAGVLVYIIYVDLLGAAKIWVEREQSPEPLGLWWVHAVFLTMGCILLARQFGYLNGLSLRRGLRAGT